MQLNGVGTLIQKGGLILLNFVDDIAVFALTRLGLHWTWLQWLSTALLIITLLYWSFRLGHYLGGYYYRHIWVKS